MNDHVDTDAPTDQQPSALAGDVQGHHARKPYTPPRIEHVGALDAVMLDTAPPTAPPVC